MTAGAQTNNRAVSITVVLAIVLLAIAARVVETYATSWEGGHLIPYDTDNYYQLRRVELLRAGQFPPGVPDGFVNAPARFDCPWPVGLPLLLAGAVSFSPVHAEAIAAHAIPILGALTPLLLMMVLWRYGRSMAWLAGLAAAVIPPSRMAGHFGRIDHHVLEAAFALLLLLFAPAGYGLVKALRGRAGLIAGIAVGALAAWTCDFTFVALALLAAISTGAALIRRPLQGSSAMVLGVSCGVVLATLADLLIGAPRTIAWDLRLAIALAFLASGFLGAVSGRRRTALWVGLGALLLVAIGRGMPLAVWLTAPTDTVTARIDEAQAPWVNVTPGQALFHLVPMGAAVAALGLGQSRRGRILRRDLPLLAFLVGLTAIYLAQAKYQAQAALLEACGWGFLPVVIAGFVPAAWRLLRGVLAPATCLLVVAMSALLAPPNPRLPQVKVAHDLHLLAQMVRGRVADPAWSVPSGRPASVTLAHPDDGVRFGHFAHVAVPSLPFWSQPTSLKQIQQTLAMFSKPYGAALEKRMNNWRVRYVLVTIPRPSLGFYEQLRVIDGAAQGDWPAAATLRHVAESGTAKLFERVAGAKVQGITAPGTRVELEAFAKASSGRPLRFVTRAFADPEGHFALVFPYASEGDGWPTHVLRLQLSCGDRPPRSLTIPELAVTSGAIVPVSCE